MFGAKKKAKICRIHETIINNSQATILHLNEIESIHVLMRLNPSISGYIWGKLMDYVKVFATLEGLTEVDAAKISETIYYELFNDRAQEALDSMVSWIKLKDLDFEAGCERALIFLTYLMNKADVRNDPEYDSAVARFNSVHGATNQSTSKTFFNVGIIQSLEWLWLEDHVNKYRAPRYEECSTNEHAASDKSSSEAAKLRGIHPTRTTTCPTCSGKTMIPDNITRGECFNCSSCGRRMMM